MDLVEFRAALTHLAEERYGTALRAPGRREDAMFDNARAVMSGPG